MAFSVTAPLLFALAHERIFAQPAVALAGAPFTAVDTFGVEDAVPFLAGLVLGLLSPVFGAVDRDGAESVGPLPGVRPGRVPAAGG